MLRLAVRVRREDAELVLAELIELAPSGVEETDLGDSVEYAVYGAPGEIPALPDLRAAAGEALVEVTTTEVADDWDERWKAFHQPIEIADRLRVRAPWHQGARDQGARDQGARDQGAVARDQGARDQGAVVRDQGARDQGAVVGSASPWHQGARDQGAWHQGPRDQGAWHQGARDQGAWHQGPRDQGAVVGPERPRHPGVMDVVIDPGQAFGTGSHATTRLCLELLCDLEPTGALVDAGCGSGVLAIAAAGLGWAPVIGLDHERESVTATAANAAVNGVEIDVRRWDLRDEPVPVAATVVANLLRPLLLALRFEQPPATLIASGLLVGEGDEIAAALAREGLAEVRRLERDGWTALLLARPSAR